MESSISKAINKVHTSIGQGSILEQIDKRFRRQQRLTLFKMLEKVDKSEMKKFPVTLYKHVKQNGKNK
jgi:hypothetical protein